MMHFGKTRDRIRIYRFQTIFHSSAKKYLVQAKYRKKIAFRQNTGIHQAIFAYIFSEMLGLIFMRNCLNFGSFALEQQNTRRTSSNSGPYSHTYLDFNFHSKQYWVQIISRQMIGWQMHFIQYWAIFAYIFSEILT